MPKPTDTHVTTLDLEVALQGAFEREAEAARLLEYALHLRQHGERAPGGAETWAQFDRNAETFLRARLAAADDCPGVVCTGPGVPADFTCTHPSHARLAAGTEPWTVPVDHAYVGTGPKCAQCTRSRALHSLAAGTEEG
jgi:hypothetical protein